MEKFFPTTPAVNDEEITAQQKAILIINSVTFLAQSGMGQKAGPAAYQRIEKLARDLSVWIRDSGGLPQDNSAILLGIDAMEKLFKSLPPAIIRGGH